MAIQEKIRIAGLVVLIVISIHSFKDLDAQTQNHFKFGMEGGIGLVNPDDVNDAIDNWINAQADIILLQGNENIRLNFDISIYFGFLIGDFFEIRPEFGFFFAPKLINASTGNGLNVFIWSFDPGISANLLPRISNSFRFQLGVGLYRYSSSIKWDEDADIISQTWKGSSLGYQVITGLVAELTPGLGLSGTIIYRNAKIDEIKNEDDEVIQNFNLDLSGVDFRVGFYFSF